jgi:hypothetical protein
MLSLPQTRVMCAPHAITPALTALRATIALSEGRNLVAKLLIDEARARITSEIGGDRVSPWREAASLALVAAEVAVATSAGEAAMVEAENALTILAEDELGHVDTAIMKARAYELQGEAFLLLGNESLADRAFRMGLAELAPQHGPCSGKSGSCASGASCGRSTNRSGRAPSVEPD